VKHSSVQKNNTNKNNNNSNNNSNIGFSIGKEEEPNLINTIVLTILNSLKKQDGISEVKDENVNELKTLIDESIIENPNVKQSLKYK
jgi:hypothetical protein